MTTGQEQVEGQPPRVRDTWEQLPREGPRAFAGFMVYLQLGAQRSIDRAWREATGRQQGSKKRAPGRWMLWSSQYGWVQRSADFDGHMARQQQRAMADTLEAVASERIRAYRRLLSVGEKIIIKAELGDLTVAEARENIGQARMLIDSAGRGLRAEAGEPDPEAPAVNIYMEGKPASELTDDEVTARLAEIRTTRDARDDARRRRHRGTAPGTPGDSPTNEG